MLAGERQQHIRCVVLDGALAKPPPEHGCGRAIECLVAEMLAHAREMIDARPRAHAVLEQLVRGGVDLAGDELQRRRRQPGEVVGHEPQKPQRAELDREAEAVGGSTLGEDERAVAV